MIDNTNLYAFVIDDDGFVTGATIVDTSNRKPLMNEITEGFPIDKMLHKPKWDGVQWVEGESQAEREERESQVLLESLNPSEKELSKAERELETIELLLEMGLI